MATKQASQYGPVTSRLTARRVVGIWGIIVATGWIVTQLAIFSGSETQTIQEGLTAFWLVGSLVPISASFVWMRKDGFTGLFPIWTLLGVTGLVASFAVVGEAVSIEPALVYGALWFAGPAVGFFVTAWYMNDWSRQLYAVVGVLNLICAGLVVAVSGFAVVYGAVAAVVQGGPMVYHALRMD